MWISLITKEGQRTTVNTDNVLYVLAYADMLRIYFTKDYFRNVPDKDNHDYLDVNLSINEFNKMVKGEKEL